tara:strand:+ start:4599 stop:4940 length:342 start_codon:yes stop_codon:yes gene_type:complete
MKSTVIRITSISAFLFLLLPGVIAQDEQGEGLSSLLDSLKDSVKDLDMGEGMKDLPKQFSQLKQNYAEQTAAMEEMKTQIAMLKAEMQLLKKEVALLKGEKPEDVVQDVTTEE